MQRANLGTCEGWFDVASWVARLFSATIRIRLFLSTLVRVYLSLLSSPLETSPTIFLSIFPASLQTRILAGTKRYIRLRISTKAIKTLNKVGLEKMAKDAGLDLMSLAYQQADDARAEWLAADMKNDRKDKGRHRLDRRSYSSREMERARMSKLSPEEKRCRDEGLEKSTT